MTVAATILEQLGGNRFCAMTGAKDFVSAENAIFFALPGRFAKDGINLVSITLTDADDYTVNFSKRRGVVCKTVKEFEGVYADNLREVFESATGLYTSL